jgi:Ca-activated chloride channel family protein
VTFDRPLMLVALVAVPVLLLAYLARQRQRAAAEAAFLAPHMTASALPARPRWRRHAPMLLLAAAITALILAAARPERRTIVPVDGAGIMLANDVSSSMSSTDVRPSRLGAAKRAALRFLGGVPGSVSVGQIEFARHPTLLQSPTTDHALTGKAIAALVPGGGGTAIGDAIQTALRSLSTLRRAGKKLPGAILLLSDGTSNVGVSPYTAAEQAKAAHIPIYTIALGTAHGTISITRRGRAVSTPVPVSPGELGQIAKLSGGKAYTAADSARASAIYAHLATKLGQKHVKQEITVDFVGAGVILLVGGGVLSLLWFARIV